jgi:hypothetical protein
MIMLGTEVSIITGSLCFVYFVCRFVKALEEKKRAEERRLALEQARARGDAHMYLKAKDMQKLEEEAAAKKARLEEETAGSHVDSAAAAGVAGAAEDYLTTKSTESSAALYDKMSNKKDVHRYETASALEAAISEKALSERSGGASSSDSSQNVSVSSTLQRNNEMYDNTRSIDPNELYDNTRSLERGVGDGAEYSPEDTGSETYTQESLSRTEETSVTSLDSGAGLDRYLQTFGAGQPSLEELYDTVADALDKEKGPESQKAEHQKVRSPEKGAQLYDKAKSLEKTSDFYSKAKALERSTVVYDKGQTKAKSLERGAAMYEKAKALERGADVYEKAKSLECGADLYENTKSLEKGGELYENTKALERQHAEELKSTASDEGVIMKGGSAEELEEREFRPVRRRDSEE